MKKSIGSQIFDICNITFFIFIGCATLYPFWHVLITSIIPYEDAVKSAIRIIPKHFDFQAYAFIFSNDKLLRALFTSASITVVCVIYHTLLTAMTGYVLTKKDLPGRQVIFIFIIFTMFFSGGLIPTYLLNRSLGLVDNLLVMVLPGAVSAYNMIVMKTFFNSIPAEMEESARIDGAGYLLVFFRIILPLAIPSFATIGLFIAVNQWNNWFIPMIYINNRKLWPLALVLRDILINTDLNSSRVNPYVNKDFLLGEGVKMGIIIVSLLPIIIIYPFMQKYFVKGMMIGAVKS